jgi:hypothetical protein
VLGEWMTPGAGERLKQLRARTCAELRQRMPLLARRQHTRVPKGRVRVPEALKQVAAPDGTTEQITVVASRRIPLPQQLDTACLVRVGRHSICAPAPLPINRGRRGDARSEEREEGVKIL